MKTIVRVSDGRAVWQGENPANKPNLTPPAYVVIDGTPPNSMAFPVWDFVNGIWANDQAAEQTEQDDKTQVTTNRQQGKQAYKDFKQLVNSNPTWDQATLQNGMELIRKALRGLYVREGN